MIKAMKRFVETNFPAEDDSSEQCHVNAFK